MYIKYNKTLGKTSHLWTLVIPKLNSRVLAADDWNAGARRFVRLWCRLAMPNKQTNQTSFKNKTCTIKIYIYIKRIRYIYSKVREFYEISGGILGKWFMDHLSKKNHNTSPSKERQRYFPRSRERHLLPPNQTPALRSPDHSEAILSWTAPPAHSLANRNNVELTVQTTATAAASDVGFTATPPLFQSRATRRLSVSSQAEPCRFRGLKGDFQRDGREENQASG